MNLFFKGTLDIDENIRARKQLLNVELWTTYGYVRFMKNFEYIHNFARSVKDDFRNISLNMKCESRLASYNYPHSDIFFLGDKHFQIKGGFDFLGDYYKLQCLYQEYDYLKIESDIFVKASWWKHPCEPAITIEELYDRKETFERLHPTFRMEDRKEWYPILAEYIGFKQS